MDIHQMQVRYDPRADRLLWQVRTRSGKMMATWLTRRMVARLWPPFQQLVTQSGMAAVAPGATIVPEAREMMAQAARQRPLPHADFKAPFDATPAAQPLGPEPLLPEAIDLAPGAGGKGLAIRLREPGGRSLELRLGDDLATALLRLLEQALASSDWFPAAGTAAAAGLAGTPASPGEPGAPGSTPPSALN